MGLDKCVSQVYLFLLCNKFDTFVQTAPSQRSLFSIQILHLADPWIVMRSLNLSHTKHHASSTVYVESFRQDISRSKKASEA